MPKQRLRRPWRPALDAADATHALQVLVAIADLGSFTAAAAHLDLTPSAVSKAVTRIEARLGVRLLLRTTHRVALTDVGEAYVARGRSLLGNLEELERDTSSRDDTLRGVVRVSAPTVYGALKVAPLVAEAQRQHPDLDVHLWCEDRLIDMIAERVDVAVRMLGTPPAELVARDLGEDRRGLYASTAYLRRAKVPTSFDDLRAHAAIIYGGSSAAPQLKRGRVVFETDNILAAREAARASVGIAELPEYLALKDVEEGRLREILPGAIPATRKIYVLYLPSRHLPRRVRTVVDALVRERRRESVTARSGA
jgi:DNA-binding transcriptional LysR family regulator